MNPWAPFSLTKVMSVLKKQASTFKM